MLRQNTAQYLILSLMGLMRTVKTRFYAFEEEFALTIIDTMKLTEQMPNSNHGTFKIYIIIYTHIKYVYVHSILH
jgi:hypothetical protein